MTRCECAFAGFCPRHNVKKAARMVALCQTDMSYWQAWEENRGPGQLQPNHGQLVDSTPTVEYNHWGPLHYYGVKHRDNWDASAAKLWYAAWFAAIPPACGCKDKWTNLNIEPDYSTAEAFFAWAHGAHQIVNRQLGKQCQPTLEDARRIWGWA